MSIDSRVIAPQDAQPITQPEPASAPPAAGPVAVPVAADVEELLVEEVSIDGMCGVY